MSKSTHETFTRPHEEGGPTNKSFGLTVGGILLVIAAIKYYFHTELTLFTSVLAFLGLPLFFAGALFPKILTPFNKAWMALGFILGKIVSPIVMLMVYCVAFVPTSLILRLRGYDPLKKNAKNTQKSHWIERDPAGPNPEEIINQF